jgi:hypothetical protein
MLALKNLKGEAMRSVIVIPLSFLFLVPATPAAQAPLMPVALTGQTVPGTGGATYAGFLGFPANALTGEVGFLAQLAGPGVNAANDEAYVRGLPGLVNLVAREGDPAPGAGGDVFVSGPFPSSPAFRPLRLGPGGTGGFIGYVRPPGGTFGSDEVLYTVPATGAGEGPPRLVAREDAPGTPYRIEDFVSAAVNNAGHIAFAADLSPAGAGVFLDTGAAGGFITVAAPGQAAPGAGAGVTYERADSPSINNAGRVAFATTLAGAGGTRPHYAVYAGPADAPALVARTGDAAPGVPGATLDTVYGPSVTDSGLVAFGAQLAGPGIGPTQTGAIYFGAPDAPQLIARYGTALTGSDAAVGGVSVPAVNSAGQFAFAGSVQGGAGGEPAGEAMFAGSLTTPLRLLAREGDAVPGLAGYRFANAGSDDTVFGRPTINGLGQVAFGSILEDPTGLEVDGLFAAGPSGTLRLVAYTGQQVLLAPGDLRTIAGLPLANYALAAGEGGLPLNLNDAGRLVFQADFTDGSQGILVAVIPEPGAACVLSVLGAWALGRRGPGNGRLPKGTA